jgi:cytoskeletal protein RodZ
MASAPPANTDIGAVLRARREALGLTLDDVQAATHIRTGYLEALEENRWDHLPAEVYAVGFLRTYARYLGLDAEDLVRTWREARRPPDPEPTAEPSRAAVEPPPAVRVPRRGRARPAPSTAPRPWVWGVVVVLLLAMLVGVVALLKSHPTPTRTPVASRPASSRPAQPARAKQPRPSGPQVRQLSDTPALLAYRVTPGPVRLTLKFSAPCWVEVWVDGITDNPAGRTYEAGSTLTLSSDQSLKLLLGNPGGAVGIVNGRPVGVLGAPGVPRYLSLVAGS